MHCLFTSRVVSVTLRFGAVLPFSGSLPVVLFAFFHANKHPFVFLIHATAKQSFSHQRLPPSRRLTQYTFTLVIYENSDSKNLWITLMVDREGFEP